jgi:hypothetical protein
MRQAAGDNEGLTSIALRPAGDAPVARRHLSGQRFAQEKGGRTRPPLACLCAAD